MSAMSLTDRQNEHAAMAQEVALRGALTHIEREFGAGTLMRMGDAGAHVRCEVGNAVPPLLASVVGEHVAGFMSWPLSDSRFAVDGPPEYLRLTLAQRLERRAQYMRGGASGSSPVHMLQ